MYISADRKIHVIINTGIIGNLAMNEPLNSSAILRN